MKTCAMIKMCSVLVAVTLAGSVAMAGDHGRDRGDYRGGRGDGGRSYHGSYDRGHHYGYYRNSRGELFFGLLGIGMAAAIVAAVDRPVYVQQPAQVVYQAPPVVYVQQPQVVYVQQPQVMQQPVVVQVEPPRPVSVTINLQNSNGSFTPVTLQSSGSQWVGPKGEYYESMPTVGQLRQLYGF